MKRAILVLAVVLTAGCAVNRAEKIDVARIEAAVRGEGVPE